jgi:phosphate transport system protein
MSKHLERDLKRVEKGILSLGSLVEEAVNRAILALVSRRTDLAQEVIDGDAAIDEREVEFEEDCLKALALHQPVAQDLRFLVAALKVNRMLERMGDLAVNIAKCAIRLAKEAPVEAPLDFPHMVATVRNMVRQSLDSLVQGDPQLAYEVLAQDDDVDSALRQIHNVLKELMKAHPDTIEGAVNTLIASRHLERIADYATNIAEDVVFMVEGEIIRHQPVERGA